MKTIKKLLFSVILATLVFATCGISVSAATKNKTLKQNVWFTQKAYGDTVYNKITIPSDGYITITVKNTERGSVWIDIYNKSKTYITEPVYSSNKEITVKYPVQKGTYYLRGTSYYNYKYKYTFTKAVNKDNYCAGKALNLKAKTEVVVVNTPMNDYDRWYKIKLTSKKCLSYWISGTYSNITLYDSDFDSLDTVYDSEDECYYTRKVLSKGTYYVRLRGYGYYYSYYNSLNPATMTTFKWK